jgi:hypothetical protein
MGAQDDWTSTDVERDGLRYGPGITRKKAAVREMAADDPEMKGRIFSQSSKRRAKVSQLGMGWTSSRNHVIGV